jgi:beta-mannosidase
MWDYHTKDNPPMDLFGFTRFYAKKMLGAFKDGKDRFMKLKYIQYEWVRISLEQARREKWFCSGIIYWMLNDCWPAASGWALLDYYNYPKAALYSFKRCAKDVMATIDRNKDKSFSLYVSNEVCKNLIDRRFFPCLRYLPPMFLDCLIG